MKSIREMDHLEILLLLLLQLYGKMTADALLASQLETFVLLDHFITAIDWICRDVNKFYSVERYAALFIVMTYENFDVHM